MANIFRTKTFWAALATGITGVLHATRAGAPLTEIIPWVFGALTAIFLRSGVQKSEPPRAPFGRYLPHN